MRDRPEIALLDPERRMTDGLPYDHTDTRAPVTVLRIAVIALFAGFQYSVAAFGRCSRAPARRTGTARGGDRRQRWRTHIRNRFAEADDEVRHFTAGQQMTRIEREVIKEPACGGEIHVRVVPVRRRLEIGGKFRVPCGGSDLQCLRENDGLFSPECSIGISLDDSFFFRRARMRPKPLFRTPEILKTIAIPHIKDSGSVGSEHQNFEEFRAVDENVRSEDTVPVALHHSTRPQKLNVGLMRMPKGIEKDAAGGRLCECHNG